MSRILPLTVIACTLAFPAFAGTSFTAKLAAPLDSADEIVAAKAIWFCENDTCVGELNRRTVTVRTCKKVASEVGELAAFSNDKESLSEEDLASCNEAAKD